MIDYRENTIDKEPLLINKFHDELMRVESEKSQESKNKIKTKISDEINSQLYYIKRDNRKKQPIYLSYQDIGTLDLKNAKKFVESLGFKASIHRGNILFQKIYNKLYVYKKPDAALINFLSILIFLFSSTITLIAFKAEDYIFNYNKFYNFINTWSDPSVLFVKAITFALFILPLTILVSQVLFFAIWKMYCFFSYFSFKSGVIKIDW